MKKLFWDEVNGELTFEKVLPYVLIIVGIIGVICSFALTYDIHQIALNPNYHPSCNLNPIVSCGDVAASAQGTVFGNIPNPWLGMMAFPVPITLGVVLLAGAKFRRWLWQALWGGTLVGVIFVHWFFFESVYRLQALCPFCMGVWVVSITMFWYVTLYVLEKGYLKISRKERNAVAKFAQHHHLDILILWFLVIAALILTHFWYYYGKHLFH